MRIEKIKTPVWAVYTNTDLTEGRGIGYALCYCQYEATARRKAKGAGVMGTDCEIKQEDIYNINGVRYFPHGLILTPTKEDIDEENKLREKRKLSEEAATALDRARRLGLSEDDINSIIRGLG